MLRFVRGARLDRLLDAMLAAMAASPLPPLQQEIVVIQGRGLDRWISQQAALRQGGWGFVETLFPRPFLLRAFASVLDDAAPTVSIEDGVARLELELRVAGCLPGLLDDPRFAEVAAVLRAGAGVQEEALALAPRIAAVLDRAMQHRVEMVRGWLLDDGVDIGAVATAAGAASTDERWLAELWRRAMAGAAPSRLLTDRERFLRACTEVHGVPRGLPPRLSIFGVSTLAPAFLELVEALGQRIEVTVYALDPAPGQAPHALVESWGTESIEFAAMMDERLAAGRAVVTSADTAAPLAEGSGRLAWMQQTLRGEAMSGRAAQAFAEGAGPPEADDSLQFHCCHGSLDEVTMAFDAIVALLRREPSLQPRDIAILTPDIDHYGPLVEAVFGARRDERGRALLPFAVADRQPETAHAVEAFARLLELARSRCERSELLEVMALQPIIEGLGLVPGDLEQVEAWSEHAQVRWGLDADHRSVHGRPGEIIGTWRWGLDRLHLGAIAAEGTTAALGTDEPVAPAWAVEGSAVGTLEALERLCAALSELACARDGRRPLVAAAGEDSQHAWLAAIDRLAERVLGASARDDGGGAIVRSRLAALRSTVEASGFVGAAHAIDARSAVSFVVEQLRDQHPGRGLLASGVTVASLQPMRSIPFRVIVLVGMSEGAIPRRVVTPSFDLVAADRRTGDRDARLDDRQVMLETLFAASRALVMTWPGVDPTSGESRPPSVLIDELLEVLAQTPPAARSLSSGVGAVRRRADAGAVETGAVGGVAVHAGPVAIETITIDQFQRFWRSPVEACMASIGVRFDRPRSSPAEEDPISHEFEALLLGASAETELAEPDDRALDMPPLEVLAGSGWLPRGVAQRRVFDAVDSMRRRWLAAAEEIARGAGAADGLRASIDCADLDLVIDAEPSWMTGSEARLAPARLRVAGRLNILRGVGPLLVQGDPGKNPFALLRGWIDLLLWCASGRADGADGGVHGGALLLSRKAEGRGDERTLDPEARLLAAMSSGEARAHLARLVMLRDHGRRSVIPFTPRCSLAYAHHREKRSPCGPEEALDQARQWFFGERGEASDPAIRALLGPGRFFDGCSPEGLEADAPLSFRRIAEAIGRPMVRAAKDGTTTAALIKAPRSAGGAAGSVRASGRRKPS